MIQGTPVVLVVRLVCVSVSAIDCVRIVVLVVQCADMYQRARHIISATSLIRLSTTKHYKHKRKRSHSQNRHAEGKVHTNCHLQPQPQTVLNQFKDIHHCLINQPLDSR